MYSLPFCHRAALLCACAILFIVGCSKSVSVGSKTSPTDLKTPPIEITHEDCDVEAKSAEKADVNNDGRADITRVMEGSREVCRVLDLNFDGRVDNFLYFDETGNLRRRESDFDRDGIIDEIGFYQNGKVIQKHRETNLDGKLDTWDTYSNEQLTERLRDTNGDGRVDQWWTFPDPNKIECPIVATDEDGDGAPDARHDPCKERDAEMNASAQPWEAEKQGDAGASEGTSEGASEGGTTENPADTAEPADKDGGS